MGIHSIYVHCRWVPTNSGFTYTHTHTHTILQIGSLSVTVSSDGTHQLLVSQPGGTYVPFSYLSPSSVTSTSTSTLTTPTNSTMASPFSTPTSTTAVCRSRRREIHTMNHVFTGLNLILVQWSLQVKDAYKFSCFVL